MNAMRESEMDPKMDSEMDLKVGDCLGTFGDCTLEADVAQPLYLLQHFVFGNEIGSVFLAAPWGALLGSCCY